MADPVFLSVVMPVYNEEKCIRESLRRIEAFLSLKGLPWEVLVSSDGSTDGTDTAVRSFIQEKEGRQSRVRLLSSAGNKGKGDAVRRGVLAAEGKFILLTDADLSAPIKESDKLIAELESGADVAIGSRAMREKGCDVQQTLKRRLAGRVFNALVRAVALKGIRDTQCGFKCFKKEAARDLFAAQTLDGFSFDVEILYLAKKKGYQIKETAVMWKEGADSRVRLFRDSLRMAKDLFIIRKRHG
ncbi:MAG: glycosyltransferase family 2 protein [Candidatus Omnitrophica bacterium]|nr:glycosyltransferase family 2 protein [Candidatus Omnitrophota bacterium]